MRRVVAVALLALLAAGCSADPVATVKAPSTKVDTAELRAFKATTDIADCEKQTAPVAKDGLPDVELPCLGGGPDVAIARLRGPMVVNLWAQWCDPCREELPFYQQFHEKYAGKVGVLGVAWQETHPDAALELAKASGITYPLVADLQPSIPGMYLPRLIMLDAAGRIVFKQDVVIKDLAQLEKLVEQHLGVSVS